MLAHTSWGSRHFRTFDSRGLGCTQQDKAVQEQQEERELHIHDCLMVCKLTDQLHAGNNALISDDYVSEIVYHRFIVYNSH